MSDEVLYWLAGCTLFLATFTAIGTRVLQRFPRHELEEFCLQRNRSDIFHRLMDSYERYTLASECFELFFSVCFSFSFFALVFKGPIGNETAYRWFSLIVILAFIMLVCTSWIPWAFVRLWAVPFLFLSWRIWWAMSILAWPLAIGVSFISAIIRRVAGTQHEPADKEEALEDEIMSIVATGEREGLLEAAAREMIEGVIELDDVVVGAIMTPRSKIEAVEASESWEKILRHVCDSGHSRIPVYADSLDHVVGVLFVKDLLTEVIKPLSERRDITRLCRPPIFVPESKLADEMLSQFLKTRNHLAIVVDEFESVVGIVTIEDVLEEIVGEIDDETDSTAAKEIEVIRAGVYETLGHTKVSDINASLGLTLPESDEYDTVGGLVLAELKHLPTLNERLTLGEVTLEVIRMNPRNVERIRLEVEDRMIADNASNS